MVRQLWKTSAFCHDHNKTWLVTLILFAIKTQMQTHKDKHKDAYILVTSDPFPKLQAWMKGHVVCVCAWVCVLVDVHELCLTLGCILFIQTTMSEHFNIYGAHYSESLCFKRAFAEV